MRMDRMEIAELLMGYVLLVFLFVAVIQDLKSRKIKNWWNLMGLCAAFVLSFFRKDFSLAEFFSWRACGICPVVCLLEASGVSGRGCKNAVRAWRAAWMAAVFM